MSSSLANTPAPIPEKPANTAAREWLAAFDAALTSRNLDAAVALFGAECYWRDLISFTWNICTQESPDQVRAMLAARLDDVAPSNWQLEGDASEAGGITEAWFTFETRLSRGRGLLRLKEEDGQSKAWTLLTSMVELKGHEEKTGEHRAAGAEHGVHKHRKSWSELKAEEAQPEVVIIGGGQGGIALGARLRRLGVSHLVIEKNARPATAGAAATRPCACTTRSGTTTCPTCPSRPLAGVRAQGQDRRLAGDVHQGHGAQLLGSDQCQELPATTPAAQRWDVAGGARRRDGAAAPEAAGARHRHVRLPTCRSFPGPDVFEGEQCIRAQHPGPEAWRGKKVRGDRLQQLGARHLRRAVGERRRRDHGAALLHHIVARSETLMDWAGRRCIPSRRCATASTTDKADLIFASLPYKIMPTFQNPGLRRDPRARRRLLRAARGRPASCSTSARTAPACS
jgi:putative flavoprotein involved in K+ transport